MIRIAAVDDEIHILERFERMVDNIPGIHLAGVFETGEQFIHFLDTDSVDVVFMDIEMSGINGLSLCQSVLEHNENIDVVFVTAYNNYAISAFEVNAIDYVMKPLTEERLHKIIKKILKRKNKDISDNMPRIQCFGSFELFVNGESVTWKNSKAKEILAYLVYKKGEPVNWEKIADAVWPDYDTDKAHTNFHATTYLLRKRLIELDVMQIIDFKRGNYRIVKEQITCDAYIIEEKIKKIDTLKQEDYMFLKSLKNHGYMQENEYELVYPQTVEFEKKFEYLVSKNQMIEKEKLQY